MSEFKFNATYCSNCGQQFGPGDSGFSHCENHAGLFPVTVRSYRAADWVRSFDEIKAEASAQTMAEIEVMVENRLAEYRALCEAEADEESLEDGMFEPVRVFTDAELRDEYEVVEEDGDCDRDDY